MWSSFMSNLVWNFIVKYWPNKKSIAFKVVLNQVVWLLKKDVVAGLGEIGNPILQLISKVHPTIGYDINDSLVDKTKIKK